MNYKSSSFNLIDRQVLNNMVDSIIRNPIGPWLLLFVSAITVVIAFLVIPALDKRLRHIDPSTDSSWHARKLAILSGFCGGAGGVLVMTWFVLQWLRAQLPVDVEAYESIGYSMYALIISVSGIALATIIGVGVALIAAIHVSKKGIHSRG